MLSDIRIAQKAKKKSIFDMLNDSEVDELEEIVRNSFKLPHATQNP